MYIGPLPIFAWGGILLLLMTIAQVLMGLRVIPVDMKYHKINGILILIFGIFHGTLALIFLLG